MVLFFASGSPATTVDQSMSIMTGDSLLEAFMVAFNIKPIAVHYQQELESMRSEPYGKFVEI